MIEDLARDKVRRAARQQRAALPLMLMLVAFAGCGGDVTVEDSAAAGRAYTSKSASKGGAKGRVSPGGGTSSRAPSTGGSATGGATSRMPSTGSGGTTDGVPGQSTAPPSPTAGGTYPFFSVAPWNGGTGPRTTTNRASGGALNPSGTGGHVQISATSSSDPSTTGGRDNLISSGGAARGGTSSTTSNSGASAGFSGRSNSGGTSSDETATIEPGEEAGRSVLSTTSRPTPRGGSSSRSMSN
ncbi:MAG: hypothetical protein ACM3ZE_13420 [Myxococcales bacterium]